MKINLIVHFCLGLSVCYKTVTVCHGQCVNPVKRNNLEFVRINRTEVRFHCRKGYVLYGNPVSSCQNEQWTPSGQRCNLFTGVGSGWMGCGKPGCPADGSLYVEKMSENKLSYDCNYGFVISGERHRSCQPDGIWTPRLPKCVKNLAINKPALHEPHKKTNIFSTDGAQNTCTAHAANFYGNVDLKQPVSFDNILINFRQTDSNEIRVYVTSNTNVADINFRNIKYLDQIYNKTFENTSSQLITVNVTEARYLIIWFKKQTVICQMTVFNSKERTGCGKPDQPLHARILKSDSNSVTYTCNRGYVVRGMKDIRCKSGVWDGDYPPQCVLKPTLAPQNLSRSSLISGGALNDPTPNESTSNKVVGIIAGSASFCLILIALFYKFTKNSNLKNDNNYSENHVLENEVFTCPEEIQENDGDVSNENLQMFEIDFQIPKVKGENELYENLK